MKVSPSAVAGVSLLGPDSPSFEQALRSVLGRAPIELIRPALPFSVIVENESSRTIAFMGIRFDMTSAKGKSSSVVHYADTLRYPERADFRPGGKRFVCAEPTYTSLVMRGGDTPDTRGRMNLDNLRRMLRIRVSVDSVAFDNGRFYGPDTAGAFTRFTRERVAEKSMVIEVLGMSEGPITAMEAALFEAVQNQEERGRRKVARDLMDALDQGGRDLLIERARNWNYRIELSRTEQANP